MKEQRAELHLHTTMSAMDGIGTVRDYINFASAEKLPAIAITDHASVQAFPEAYAEMWRHADSDLKLIYGNEIYMVNDNKDTYHASILVINKPGLKNLYKLVSLANTEYFDKVPKTPKSELEKHRDGLLIGSGCDAGELYHAVRDGKTDDELIEIAKFYDYLEVVPTGNFEYYIEQGYVKDREDLIAINKKIIEIGEMTKKPVVALSDAHYAYAEDMIIRKILMFHKGFENYEKQPLLCVRTTDEMLAEFSYLGEEKAYEIVVENTNEIADMVDAEISPVETEDNYEADIKELEDLVYKRLHEKYGEKVPEECLNRAESELSVISRNKRNIFNMLVCSRLAGIAAKKGLTVGSRGSVASSYVAYLAGITEINPLNAHYYCPKCHYIEFHNEYYCGADMPDKICSCKEKLAKDGFTIPHETFFRADSSFVIDIDLNYPSEYQDQAFENLKDEAGVETIRRGAIHTIPYRLSRKIVNRYCKENGAGFNNQNKEKIINKLCDIKLTTALHPGGVFIIPNGKEINDYTPVQYPANIKELGLSAHFDYHALYSLLEIDILTLDTISMLRILEDLTGVNAKDIPLDDKKTSNLFSERKTLGISEFESNFVREHVMNKIKTYSFDNLIRISGLSHGTDVWRDNGENLVAEGKELRDIVSCRDDVMLYLLSRGIERKEALDISECIRKGRELAEEQYDMLIKRGVEKWRLDSWNKIKYSFPRAHAAAYVLNEYRVAYYKAHFPLEFYCAYLNVNKDYFDPSIIIDNAKELPQEIQKIKESKKEDKSDYLTMLRICLEMYEAGYKIIKKKAENKNMCFSIENGNIRYCQGV